MTFARTILALGMSGSLLGATLAVTVPPTRAFAQTQPGGGGGSNCKCDDNPESGASYKCNGAQTSCLAGSEKCTVTCT